MNGPSDVAFARRHAAAHRRMTRSDAAIGHVTSVSPVVIELPTGRLTDQVVRVAAGATLAVDDAVLVVYAETGYVVVCVVAAVGV